MPARERAPKRLPCAAFFGYFLVRAQESDIIVLAQQYDKLKFEHRRNEPGGPNGVTIPAGLPVTRLSAGTARKIKLEKWLHL